MAATEAVITAFSRPFVQTRVHELLRRGQPLIYDLDLTRQAISSTSTTYPDAALGSLRLNDQLRLGYQLARVSLSAGASQRIWLAAFHHPGDSVSSACLKEMIRAAEIQTGVHPRRQPERVSQRIAAQQAVVARIRRMVDQH